MMKHLLSYKRFEALAISLTEDPEDKSAKEEINKTETYLKDYNAIKGEIDSAFASMKDNLLLNKKLEEISKRHQGNTLIDEYIRVAGLQKKVKDAEEELASYSDEKFSSQEELKGLNKSDSDPASIQAKQKTINDITKKQSQKKTDIDLLKREVLDAEKKMKEQMQRMKKDSADNMANL